MGEPCSCARPAHEVGGQCAQGRLGLLGLSVESLSPPLHSEGNCRRSRCYAPSRNPCRLPLRTCWECHFAQAEPGWFRLLVLGILGPAAANGGAFWGLPGFQNPNLARDVAPGPPGRLQIPQPPTVCRPIRPTAARAGLRFHGDGRGIGDPLVFSPSATLWQADLGCLRVWPVGLHIRLAFLCAGIADLARRARVISVGASGLGVPLCAGTVRGANCLRLWPSGRGPRPPAGLPCGSGCRPEANRRGLGVGAYGFTGD